VELDGARHQLGLPGKGVGGMTLGAKQQEPICRLPTGEKTNNWSVDYDVDVE
jgi:hypothetical protein